MPYSVQSPLRNVRLRLSVIVLLGLAAACGGSDSVSPSDGTLAAGDSLAPPVDSSAVPTDSTLIPIDSTVILTGDSTSITPALAGGAAPGIMFGTFDLDLALLGALHTGTLRLPTPYTLPIELSTARARGARIVLRLSGSDSRVKNADGTFSFSKWKTWVDRFKTVNFSSYITDGTIVGHYLIDEPYRAVRWGGKIIPQSTIEQMAQYSKQLWPGMITFVRAPPSWLAGSTITYRYLDAGWAQYASYQGDATKWITAEVAKAKLKGLGIMVGANVLDGGNGSSGIRGTLSGKYSMSAAELRAYGTALLNQTYACGWFNWSYLYTGSTYFARSDIKSAMTDLSNKAKTHVKTSCRQ
jgi:hypothetical protein